MEISRDKERAKLVIVGIIRQSGGRFYNKTNLFKAFWQAHVVYAQRQQKELSDWPIVRMPNGPGIDHFDKLLGELLTEGAVETEERQYVNGPGIIFHVKQDAPHGLTQDEIEAIAVGVEYVKGQSAESVSARSHEESRAWRAARAGREIDVVLDSIPDERHQQLSACLAETRKQIEHSAT